MTCRGWNEGWVAAVWDELDAAERGRMDAHLAACVACRDALAGLRRTRDLLAAAGEPVPATPRLVVLRPPRARPSRWAFAAGVACAAIVFGFGWGAAMLRADGDRSAGAAEHAAAALEAQDRALPAGRAGARAQRQELETLVARLDVSLREIHERIARLETDEEAMPAAREVDEARVAQAVGELERRWQRAREHDLELILNALAVTELRANSRYSETRDAINLLALKHDPRVVER